MKRVLFTVTKDDCDWDTFRAGGPGGQNVNKVESAVRCTHRASGAIGISRTERSQHINKQLAFRRMAESKQFKMWHKFESARRLGARSVEDLVREAMTDRNLKIEVRGEDGLWQPAPADYGRMVAEV